MDAPGGPAAAAGAGSARDRGHRCRGRARGREGRRDLRAHRRSTCRCCWHACASDHGIRSLLCEGGPTLNSHLIAAGLVDELFLSVDPVLVGGAGALTLVAGRALAVPVKAELICAAARRRGPVQPLAPARLSGRGYGQAHVIGTAQRPAEVSNYETVHHWFALAAERLGLRDDIAEVMRLPTARSRSRYRSSSATGGSTASRAIACSTTPPAARTREASASTPTWTSKRFARWRS